MGESIGVKERTKNFASEALHRGIGIGTIRDPETRTRVKEARRAIDNEIAVPLAEGRPVEGYKRWLARRPGRATVFIAAAAVVIVPIAKETGIVGDMGQFFGVLANKVTPERAEPGNYCFSGGGLFGILNFDYEGDSQSAAGDCDFQATMTKKAQDAAGAAASVPADPNTATPENPVPNAAPVPPAEVPVGSAAPVNPLVPTVESCIAVPFNYDGTATLYSAVSYVNAGHPQAAFEAAWDEYNSAGPTYAQLQEPGFVPARGSYNLPDCDGQ